MKGERRFPLERIRVEVNPEDYSNDIFYIEGNLNCNGEGSIVLSGENNFLVNIYLPPGIYYYSILRNQYFLKGKKRKIILISKNYFFNENSKYESSGYSIYFIYSPVQLDLNFKDEEADEYNLRIIRKKYGILYCITTRNQGTLNLEINGRDIRVDLAQTNKRNNNSSMIIYQIFPDRFFKYDQKFSKKLSPWNSIPGHKSFYGGNLKGIMKKIEYLQRLNVDYIYINPIFKSHSNHRYDVDDYYEIDPLLGSKEDLKELILEAHKRGIKIIMDMVFNHTSIHHPFFKDIMENGRKSKYYNYYLFHKEKFEVFPGHCDFMSGDKECPSYETFMGYGLMPKLNLRNEDVKNYLVEVAKYWVNEFGIDGIRYDVANSLPENFISKIRREIKGIIHLGEIWCASPFFILGDYYDGITNYFLRDLIISMVSGKLSTKKFIDYYYEFLYIYGENADRSMNLLSSHDVERVLTIFSGDRVKMLLAYTILFIMNGYAMIYYGDEIGMEGGKDPDCRRTFKWDLLGKDVNNFFMRLTKMRKTYKVFREGLIVDLGKHRINGLSKISSGERLNLYFGKNEKKVKINGYILLGKGYLWKEDGTVQLKEGGFILEYLSEI